MKLEWHRIIQRLMNKNHIDIDNLSSGVSHEKWMEVFYHLSDALTRFESRIEEVEKTLEVSQIELKNKWEELSIFQFQWDVITQNIPIYSLILDVDLTLLHANKNPFPDFFQKIQGLDLATLVDVESNWDFIDTVHLSIKNQQISRGHVNVHGRYFEYVLIPLYGYQTHQNCVNIILHDVTIAKESLMALEEARAKAIYTAKISTVGEMAGSIAHEINTPLAVIFLILGRLQSIQDIQSLDLEQFQKWNESLLKNSQKISSIVNGLRKFAKGNLSQDMRDEDLFEVVTQAINLCREKLRNKNIEILNEVEPGLHFIRCQDAMIQQALFTMIQNSFEAIEGKINSWIRFRVSSEGAFLKLYVSDSGNGIPLDLINKIMIPFFSTKSSDGSTGLGLSIVRTIMEKHGGFVEYDMNAENTTFILYFPKIITQDEYSI